MFPFPATNTRGGGQIPGYIGIHDPLYARIIVIDNGLAQAVLVAFDLDRIPGTDEITKKIAEAAGVPQENVFAAATHTHNAPSVSVRASRSDPKTVRLAEFVHSRTFEAAAIKLKPGGAENAIVDRLVRLIQLSMTSK